MGLFRMKISVMHVKISCLIYREFTFSLPAVSLLREISLYFLERARCYFKDRCF